MDFANDTPTEQKIFFKALAISLGSVIVLLSIIVTFWISVLVFVTENKSFILVHSCLTELALVSKCSL